MCSCGRERFSGLDFYALGALRSPQLFVMGRRHHVPLLSTSLTRCCGLLVTWFGMNVLHHTQLVTSSAVPLVSAFFLLMKLMS